MENRSDFGSTSCLKRVLEAVLEALLLSLCAPWRRTSAQTRGLTFLGLLFAFRYPIGFRVCASTVHALAAAPCTYADAEHCVCDSCVVTYVRPHVCAKILRIYVFIP